MIDSKLKIISDHLTSRDMSTDKGKITSFFSPVSNNKGETKKGDLSPEVRLWLYISIKRILPFLILNK